MLLFLNDIAGSEVLLILFFILIFFGSKSIPGLARTLGRTIRQIKDASSELQTEIKKSGMDIKKDLNLKGMIDETAQDIRRPLDQYASDLDQAMKFEPPKHSHIPAFPTSDKSDIGENDSLDQTVETDNSESKIVEDKQDLKP
jgi:sec-independent protein translocase protein TatA